VGADRVEVVQYPSIRSQQAALGVGDAAPGAELVHECLGATQVECGEDGMCLAAEEGGPDLVVTARRRVAVVGLEDLPDGGGSDLDREGGEFAMDAAITPVRVSRASRGTRGFGCCGWWVVYRVASVGKLEGGVTAEKVAVPAQDDVEGDDQVERAQCGSGDAVE